MLQEFINQYNGKFADFDGYYGAQCVDLVQFWSKKLGGGRFWGNAVDIAGQTQDGFYEWIVNTETAVPLPGDIIVWGQYKPYGITVWGHIAIVEAANLERFVSFDQNWPVGAPAGLVAHNDYAGVLGWLRPRVLHQTPAPAPQPSPPPVAPPPPAPTPAPQTPSPVEPSLPAPEPTPAAQTQPAAAPVVAEQPVSAEPAIPSQPAPEPRPETPVVESRAPEKPVDTSVDSPLTPPIGDSYTDGMGNIIAQKLLSRKLWIAVSGIVYFILSGHTQEAVFIILGYLGAEGYVDGKK